MIDPKSRELEWIQKLRSENPRLDMQLIEKTIRAFSLLESLSLAGCPFIFKGGTATMLHLNSSRRISIDIDIICPPGTDIEKYININAEQYGFTGAKLENRISPHNVPKTHGKFYYRVSYNTGRNEDIILLDVLFEDNHYCEIERKAIHSPFLLTIGDDVYVNVPSASDILGDKLTAFAPHTTGVPYSKGDKETTMEVIKQMYDIASLSDIVYDFSTVKATFRKFVPVELSYRNLDCAIEDVTNDTINTALCLSLRGVENPEEFKLLQRGVMRINSHIISESYNIDTAIRDAAKAAYVAAFIDSDEENFNRYNQATVEELASMTIGKRLNTRLNKLKKSNPEAFFYWWQVDRLMSLKATNNQ